MFYSTEELRNQNLGDENKNNRRKPGRPTIREAIENQKILRQCFNQGLDSDYVVSSTKIGEKTIRKYFNLWKKELLENFELDLEERQKIAKARLILQYDYAIHNTKEQLDQLFKTRREREESWKKNCN